MHGTKALLVALAHPSSSKVKWGILGAGKISSDYVKAIGITEGTECVAVAARDANRAASFARSHKIPTSYGSYDDLLADEKVDVLYVGSIADQHFNQAKECILAGKNVVVEKPMTLTAKETKELITMAKDNDVMLVEGMWTRFFPAMEHVKSLIASGEIGNVVNVQGDFGWNNSECPYPSDRIWNPSSGGMTLDIGMYMAQLGQVAYPFADVSQVQAMATMKNGVDQTILANIMYENEQQGGNVGGENGMLQFYVTGAANTEERVTIQGSKGRIVLDSPAHCPQKVRLFRDIGRGSSTEEVFDFPLPDDSFTTWNYPGSIGFSYQIQSVCEALKRGEKECKQFTWNDSIQLASVMDEILAQARNPSKLNSKKVAFIPEEVPTAMLN